MLYFFYHNFKKLMKLKKKNPHNMTNHRGNLLEKGMSS